MDGDHCENGASPQKNVNFSSMLIVLTILVKYPPQPPHNEQNE